MDHYEKMARDYDKFGPIEDIDPKESGFFQRIFEQYGVKSVLDCACGTGKHLYMLGKLGVKVHGSDISPAMLAVAKENLARNHTTVPLILCDFTRLEDKLKGTYDAVVCLSTSLPHLHTDEELLKALVSMKNRLNNKGILVLTQGTSHYNLYKSDKIEPVVNAPEFSRIFFKEHDAQFQTIHVLDLHHSPTKNESNVYTMQYRILLDAEYKTLLEQAGFETVTIYGSFSGEAYDQNSRRLIVLAQKGEEPLAQIDPLAEFRDADGRINQYPVKHALKKQVLAEVAQKFAPGVQYTEKQVNAIIDTAHSFDDSCLLRRELYEQGYLGRKRDGSLYWLAEKSQ